MNNKIFITFDKSQEDIPVLTAFIENQFSMFGSGPDVPDDLKKKCEVKND